MANEYQTEQSCLSNSLTPVWGLQSVFVCCLFSRFFRYSISMFFWDHVCTHVCVVWYMQISGSVCEIHLRGFFFKNRTVWTKYHIQYFNNIFDNVWNVDVDNFSHTVFDTRYFEKKKSLHKFFTETTSRSPVRMENVALAALWLC